MTTIKRLWASDTFGRFSLTARGHGGYCEQAELRAMLAAGRTPYSRAPIIAVEYVEPIADRTRDDDGR